VYTCDWPTGVFRTVGSYLISSGAPSVNENTGLASVLLGSTAGYRVFYHDQNMTVNQLAYANGVNNNNWGWDGVVDYDVPRGNALASQFTGADNMTVAYPKDASNVGVARYNSDKLWHICTCTARAGAAPRRHRG